MRPSVLRALSLVSLLAVPVLSQEPAPPREPTPPPAPESPPPAPATPTPETPAAPAAAQPTPPPASAGSDRLEFDIKLESGKSAVGSAGDLQYEKDTSALLSGGVKIRYEDVELSADEARLDIPTNTVTAKGNVILDQGPRRLTGETLVFDLDAKTGTLSEATAHVAPDYYFNGAEIAKTGDDSYTVTDGVFTSCSQKVPDWSFRLGKARVEVEGYAHVKNASMRVKKVPVFYTPYILWPVKTERSSGLLIPNLGFSDRRGASIGLAYYQTLGRSWDTTLHLDTYAQGYLGFGDELRYRPSEGTKGAFLGYYVRDPEAVDDEWRWKVEWNHTTTDLPWGMRGAVQYQDFSDFEFFRDFERDFDRNTLRFIDSRAFLTGNWGPHLLNVLLNQRETFIGQVDTVDQNKLPEIEYRLRSTKLGRTPLYATFQGSASYLDIARPNSYAGQYGRVDLYPQLTLPVRSFPWLSLSVSGGERFTWYGDSLGPTGRAFAGESLTRALPSASSAIVGPSFSKIFDTKAGRFEKMKHILEPRFTYNYLGDFDEDAQVPLFDELDTPRSTNVGRVALVNRLLAKPSGGGSAREILLFEVSRRYSFDDAQPLQQSADRRTVTTEGPLEALLRFSPGERTSLKVEATYNTLFSGLDSTSLSGDVGFGGGNSVGLTWFTNYQPETGETNSDQVRFHASVGVWPNRLRLESQVNYDLHERALQQQVHVIHWTAQCYGIRLELRDFRSAVGPRFRDKDFRFSLTLKNVGTFLDLTSRTSSEEP